MTMTSATENWTSSSCLYLFHYFIILSFYSIIVIALQHKKSQGNVLTRFTIGYNREVGSLSLIPGNRNYGPIRGYNHCYAVTGLRPNTSCMFVSWLRPLSQSAWLWLIPNICKQQVKTLSGWLGAWCRWNKLTVSVNSTVFHTVMSKEITNLSSSRSCCTLWWPIA